MRGVAPALILIGPLWIYFGPIEEIDALRIDRGAPDDLATAQAMQTEARRIFERLGATVRLTADPAETRNIIDQSPETAADLSGKLKAFIPEAVARRPHNWQANQSIDLENDENIIKQLQALGYIE